MSEGLCENSYFSYYRRSFQPRLRTMTNEFVDGRILCASAFHVFAHPYFLGVLPLALNTLQYNEKAT